MIMSRSHPFSSGKQTILRHAISATRQRIMAVGADIGAGIARLSERHRQRRALARLDHRLLRDIGLSADIVQDELRRPFWRR